MTTELIGRENEKKVLADALHSSEAELVAVIGRRRVGKTFLISNVYAQQIRFEMTGIQDRKKEQQLFNFADQLAEFSNAGEPLEVPDSWAMAFQMLRKYLKTQIGDEKIVIFFDELPWLATHRSGFLSAFGYFWNSWAVRQNIVVVICGSAASWMIQKVVNNRGGLHNRITKRIHLQAFTLRETEQFFHKRGVQLNRYTILQLYMTLGGIPHYLKEVRKGESVAQNIQRILFSPSGLLFQEFDRLYPSLFAHAAHHIAVIRALATKHIGLSKKEILQLTKLPNGGGFSKILNELEHSGFITSYRIFNRKKREIRYRLSDEYSLFYLRFMDGKSLKGNNIWNELSQGQSYKSWCGYAFESLCLKHIDSIRKALQIYGIFSEASVFYHAGNKEEPGAQIDLVLDRGDQVINLFELKFHAKAFVISKEYAEKLRQKMWTFERVTKTKKQLFWVLISVFGVQENQHSHEILSNALTLDALFED